MSTPTDDIVAKFSEVMRNASFSKSAAGDTLTTVLAAMRSLDRYWQFSSPPSVTDYSDAIISHLRYRYRS